MILYSVRHPSIFMRKSLVCDLVEPMRPIIDLKIRKAISLKQCKEEDFESYNNQCCLSYKKSPEYIGFLIEDILQHKDEMFLFIQGYYRSFMKGKPVSSYRDFKLI